MNPLLSDTVERKFIDTLPIDDYEVLTDTGWEDLTHINLTIPYDEYEVKLEDGKSIICADTHILFNEDLSEVFAKDCNNTKIQTINGSVLVESVKKNGKQSNMFDLSVDSDNNRYYTNDILSHNSVTSVAWLLWYICFNADKQVGILANKGAISREMLSRLTLMLENLPFWLQPGCRVLNKGSIKFSNNSEIIAAATSSSSIRGKSLNCISGDAKICISKNNDIYYKKIEDYINNSELIEKEMKYIIYKITNNINRKIYVGYHSTKNIDDGYMGSGKLIKRAIEKYGIDCFSKEILSIFDTKEEAESEEKRIVDRDFTLREDTYNLSIGGNICILHGENNGFYGKKHTTESRKLISESNLGNPKDTGKHILYNGVLFKNLQDSINGIDFLQNILESAARVKLIYECGNPDNPSIFYVNIDDQLAAEEYYKKRKSFDDTRPNRVAILAEQVGNRFRGIKRSNEFCEAVSKGLTGLKKTDEHVDKINRNPEKIKKTAEKHRGMKRSDITRKNMSDAWKKEGRCAMNKGKNYFINPNDNAQKGYYFPNDAPEGWVLKKKKK